MGEIMLYNPLALGYLARHTPDHYTITLYDEYGGNTFDPDAVDAELLQLLPSTRKLLHAYRIGDRLRKRGIKTIIGGGPMLPLCLTRRWSITIAFASVKVRSHEGILSSVRRQMVLDRFMILLSYRFYPTVSQIII